MIDCDVFGGMLAKVFSGFSLDNCELKSIVKKVLNILKEENSLLEIDPPIAICGDTHGQFYDLIRIFSCGGWPPQKRYLFLGDYVDRGGQGTEVISLLFLLKCIYPNKVHLLRGNHECHSINQYYGFYNEFHSKYEAELYELIQLTFSYLPIAGLVANRIFCVHGGLSPDLKHFDQIRHIKRPIAVRSSKLVNDLLWSDPKSEITGWKKSNRGTGFAFGADVVEDFCQKLDVDLLVRAHQVVDNGYAFFANKKCITIFSAPNYCGAFSNSAGILDIDKALRCRILQLQPKVDDTKNDLNYEQTNF